MKGGKEHRVPLSDRALEILAHQMKRVESAYVFPGQRKAGLSDAALTAMLRVLGRSGVTVHGFRATFKTWAGEQTNFQNEIIEMALAHTIGTRVEQAYRRDTAIEKRRKLLDAWAAFCSKPTRTASNITPLKKKQG
jgi:integrase